MSDKVAYAYIRFSSNPQADGDSLRRQEDVTRNWCTANEIKLDNTYSLRDMGVSAFSGANLAEGELGQFIADVEAGRIRPDYLILEDLDRFSRAKPTWALEQFLRLLNLKVSVVTIGDQQIYTDNRRDEHRLYIAIARLISSHEESAVKSDRLRATWQEKARLARQGEPMTCRLPYGYRIVGRVRRGTRMCGGRIVVDTEAAAVVRHIFSLVADEHLSGLGVVQRLNREGVSAPRRNETGRKTPSHWGWSAVGRILRNRAYLGEYSTAMITEPIMDYFPRIIDDGLWARVQADLDRRARTAPVLTMQAARSGQPVEIPPDQRGTKCGSSRNLLTGLAFCAHCGAPARTLNKGRKYRYKYVCRGSLSKESNCSGKTLDLEMVESALLRALDEQLTNSRLGQYLETCRSHANDEMELTKRIRDALQKEISRDTRCIRGLMQTLAKPSLQAGVRAETEKEMDAIIARKAKNEMELIQVEAELIRLVQKGSEILAIIDDIEGLIQLAVNREPPDIDFAKVSEELLLNPERLAQATANTMAGAMSQAELIRKRLKELFVRIIARVEMDFPGQRMKIILQEDLQLEVAIERVKQKTKLVLHSIPATPEKAEKSKSKMGTQGNKKGYPADSKY